MFKIELILDEGLLTDAEAQVLRVEAQYPGAMSKPILKTVTSAGVINQEEWLVSRVEYLNVTGDKDARDLVLSCLIPAGLQVNELGENCDGCARRDPFRADMCRHVWPNQWQDRMLAIKGANDEINV